MHAHALLNLLNKSRKNGKMCGLDEHFIPVCNKFNKFINTGAVRFYLSHVTNITLKSNFW